MRGLCAEQMGDGTERYIHKSRQEEDRCSRSMGDQSGFL